MSLHLRHRNVALKQTSNRAILPSALAILLALLAGCGSDSSAGTDAGSGTAAGCPLASTGSSLSETLPSSCSVVRSDTAGNPSALVPWGEYACAPDQVRWSPVRGDPATTVTGTSQDVHLAAGENAECTITNTRHGSIKVTKQIEPSSDSGLFEDRKSVV